MAVKEVVISDGTLLREIASACARHDMTEEAMVASVLTKAFLDDRRKQTAFHRTLVIAFLSLFAKDDTTINYAKEGAFQSPLRKSDMNWNAGVILAMECEYINSYQSRQDNIPIDSYLFTLTHPDLFASINFLMCYKDGNLSTVTYYLKKDSIQLETLNFDISTEESLESAKTMISSEMEKLRLFIV